METNKYTIFLKVLECRCFSAAANELGYTQSAVSHSISSLEKQFGFKLLNRESGNVSLTRAGIDMLPYIRNVVNMQNQLEFSLSSYQDLETGTLCVATIPSLAIQHFPGLLHEYHKEHPKIHIVIIDGNYEEVEEMLAGGRVDFGFSSISESTPFEKISLFREPLQAVLPVGHPLEKKESLSLRDLEGENFIMPGEGPNHQIGDLISRYQLKLNSPYSVTDDNLTVSMVAQGRGVSVLPEMSFQNYLNFSFSARSLVEAPFREVGIIHKGRDTLSPISKSFIAFSQHYFHTHLDPGAAM